MALLITYDLNKEAKRPPIVKAIQEISGTYARLSESCYAVRTSLSPEQVYTRLSPLLDANDFIYIVTLAHPYTGFGLQEVNDWLLQNL